MQYKIPSEIGSELKINQLFYLTDLLVVLILGGIGFLFRYAVHSSFVWYYGIFWALLMFAWLIRPKTNPRLRMAKVLLLAVTRNRMTYSAIDHQSSDEQYQNE
ncbi:DUF5592 family protein [Halobacillus amylolyticus]|uniref:DUF5592 family protein n=1 Tax=Halobacillus amylolyticus TaxID=2932259 RepID=A0ABY4H6E4_9BACI|nr:DUF5592 family protein [Halobacillus amylolyticus]UOR10274.1 DUF5592 family protein [Halobacillus amylolyticus]